MKEGELKNMNPAALAFMGDAVYDRAVRERILMNNVRRVDSLHRRATGYVSASAQAKVIQTVFDDLTDRERTLVLRARNHKYHSKAKNADAMTYKWASALEALIGYLFLSGDEDRLTWILERAFEIVEGPGAEQK